MGGFAEKKIVLTGGSDGIGLALAQVLVKAGADLVIIGRRPREDVSLDGFFHYIQADLSEDHGVDDVMTGLVDLRFDKALDHLILNAGLGYVGPLLAEGDDQLKALMNVNLKSPLALCEGLYAALAEKKGSVCFVSSTAAGKPTPDFASYTASKTALDDFADNLEREWRGRVRVQRVSPGPTRTDFHQKAGLDNPPLAGLYMKPHEVAEGIAILLQRAHRVKNYSLPVVLYFAARRMLLKGKS